LCPLNQRHGDDRHRAGGTIIVSAVDAGIKVIDTCETCAEETFDHDPNFASYEAVETEIEEGGHVTARRGPDSVEADDE
jgi:hypothetical protein